MEWPLLLFQDAMPVTLYKTWLQIYLFQKDPNELYHLKWNEPFILHIPNIFHL